jgi:hypothetical protein
MPIVHAPLHFQWTVKSRSPIGTTVDYVCPEGWSVYHWRGATKHWGVVRPTGVKIATNDDIDENQISLALVWAEAVIELTGGDYHGAVKRYLEVLSLEKGKLSNEG